MHCRTDRRDFAQAFILRYRKGKIIDTLNRTVALTFALGAALVFARTPSFAQPLVALPGPINGTVIADAADTSAGNSFTDTSNLALIGGTPFLRVRTTWAGMTPQERADKVQERVNGALSVGPVAHSDITVGRVQGDWCVLFRGRRFYTADSATARLEGVSARKLAYEWAADARQKLVSLTAIP